MANRNQCNPANAVPDDILQCVDPVTLSNQLSKFVVETRNQLENTTLLQLLCGILRHMRSKNPAAPNFLEKKKDSRFRHFHGTLDSYFHRLHSEGHGRQTKHAEIMSSEKED